MTRKCYWKDHFNFPPNTLTTPAEWQLDQSAVKRWKISTITCKTCLLLAEKLLPYWSRSVSKLFWYKRSRIYWVTIIESGDQSPSRAIETSSLHFKIITHLNRVSISRWTNNFTDTLLILPVLYSTITLSSTVREPNDL